MLAVFFIAIGSVSGATVDIDMDVNGGMVDITTNGIDHSTLHTGDIGQTNTFYGIGGFKGNYKSTEGSYGRLGSYINVDSKVNGADFVMTDYQDFNVLSGNHNYNVEGNFYARASGNDGNVAMNPKSVGSMYVWSEATNGGIALQGSVIEKEAWTTKDSTLKSRVYLGVSTDGLASISNSAAWGFGNYESGTSTSNYNGGTRTVTATGDGIFTQIGLGANSLAFNGFDFGAGAATLSANFVGGMFGTYTMTAS